MNKTKRVFLLLMLALLFLSQYQIRNHVLAAPSQMLAKDSPAALVTATAAPLPAFRFVSWGDTKSGLSTLSALSLQAKPQLPAFTIYTGDLESAGFTTTGINNWKNAINAGGMFSKTFAIRGNHDYSNTAGWQTYFDFGRAATLIGGKNYNALSADLTYSFVYKNSIFIAIDVLGDAPKITSAQVAYLDKQLYAAEAAHLTNAFIFFHGPEYPVAEHDTCTTRVCPTAANVANLEKVLNKHPIVAATFHGHEHVLTWVHMDKTRIPEITRPYEEFITGSAGAGPASCSKTYRFNYCGASKGYALVSVRGQYFTVQFFKQGSTTPIKVLNFTNQ